MRRNQKGIHTRGVTLPKTMNSPSNKIIPLVTWAAHTTVWSTCHACTTGHGGIKIGTLHYKNYTPTWSRMFLYWTVYHAIISRRYINFGVRLNSSLRSNYPITPRKSFLRSTKPLRYLTNYPSFMELEGSRFIIMFTTARQVSILNQINPVHSLPTYFLKIQWSIPSRLHN
jgi:hypothetical protein